MTEEEGMTLSPCHSVLDTESIFPSAFILLLFARTLTNASSVCKRNFVF